MNMKKVLLVVLVTVFSLMNINAQKTEFGISGGLVSASAKLKGQGLNL
jgi:hypothetical protein